MRDAITTALEVAGLVTLAVALGLAVAMWSTAAGVGAAGVALVAAAALIDRPWQKPPAPVVEIRELEL